ncbi:hypothetical protein AOLI_G00180400 [Acnodon oligacanthus]
MQTAALVNRLLCAHDGRIDLEDLYGQLSGLSLRDEAENVLKDTDMFVTTGDRNKVVIAKTKMRLCRVRECQGCSNLHLCKMYLFGQCPYHRERQGCHFCHDLGSEHNISVLRQHSLLELDRTELCIILLQNDSTLLPLVCFTYNKGRGEYGNCPDKEACRRLHICESYIRGTCDDSSKCRRSHDFFEPHPMKNLQSQGVPSQLMGSMLPAYRNRLAIWDANSHRVSTRTTSAAAEICLFHIKNYCKRENRCQRVHFHLPYKWEIGDGHGWQILPDSEEIEQAFCDPAKAYSDGNVPVYFDTMTQGFAEVRRLSTASSVLNPNFIFTTTWVWYWEDESGNWVQYGSSQGTHHTPSITSEDLEKKYQEDSSATIEFTAGQHSYELNMQDMMQYNRQMGTKRSVRRRPVFLSAEDIQKIKASQKESRGPSQHSKALPHHWDKTNVPKSGFKRVLLNSATDEYKKIDELFHQTMSRFHVKCIERLQNQDLWEVFQWQRDVLRKKTAGKENEKFLFHGTESKHIDAICQQNFDWRICGVHGTAYGKGSYFARDAKYSHSYTDNQSGNRCMFVCRVLVGEYTNGRSDYLRPPLKNGEDTIFYDSCVNDISNPSIFVVFEKHQVYPEYLIQYEGEGETSPEQILMDEFSQMNLASLDDLSESCQLSRDSSFSSLTSDEETVEPVDPVLSSVTVTAPRKSHIIRHRAAIRPTFTHLKTKSFRSGIAHLSTRTHLSKLISVRKSTSRKTVGPLSHQMYLRKLGSVVQPSNMSVNDTMPVSSQNATQESFVESALGLIPENLSASMSVNTKPSNSVRTQKSRQQRSRFSRSTKGLNPVTLSTNLSPDTKISDSKRNQNARRQRTNLTGSVYANTSNSGRSQKARQQRANLTSKEVSPVTLCTGLSSDSKTSKPDRNKNAKQKLSSVPRSTGDLKTSKPVRGKNTKQELSNVPMSVVSSTNLSRETKTSKSVVSEVSSTNLLKETKTSKPVRSQSAKQELSNIPRSAGASSLVVSSTNLSSDIKTSKSVRNQNASQQRSNLTRSPGGLSPVVSSVNLSADTKTSKSVKTQNARQQTPGLNRSSGGLNPSLSTQGNNSKSVRSDSVKTQRALNPVNASKASAASQKGKTTGKGCKARH